MKIGYNYDSYFIQNGYNRGNKNNYYEKFAREFARKNHLDENATLILLFNICEIYEKHSKLVLMTQEEIDQYLNEYIDGLNDEQLERWSDDELCKNFIEHMKYNEGYYCATDFAVKDDELFNKVIDEEYLSLITLLFKDYEHHNFDYPYYRHIGSVNLKEIVTKYPNLNMETIRNVVMYSKNENVINELLKDLNNRSFDYQSKVCKLIYPMSMELISMYGTPFDYNRFYDFKYHLAEEDYIWNEKDLCYIHDKSFGEYNSISKITEENKNKFNLYFLVECEYLFQDLYLHYIDMDDEKIDKLLKFKNLLINNIPSISGEIEKDVPIHKYGTLYIPDYEYVPGELNYFSGELEVAGFNTEENVLLIGGCEDVINMNFHKKDVLILKKMYLELIPMLLNKEFDYEQILNYNLNKRTKPFVEYIFDNILSKEDILNLQQIMLDSILDRMNKSDLLKFYSNLGNSQLQNVDENSNNKIKQMKKKKYRREVEYIYIDDDD